ncbi:MAG: tetratricopeptide repeat protein [Sedimentisphaerales bacterium]|nr:tetratricopeptide repeat protein [Sedimentisphaerales bacterium]
MADIRSPVIARNFMKKLSRGAFKSIPFGGTLLEHVIYQSLPKEAAKRETAKLKSALSGILEGLKGDEAKFADIIGELEKEVALREDIRAEMGKIVALLEDPDNADVSERLSKAVEDLGIEEVSVHNLPYHSMGRLFQGRETDIEKLGSELERTNAVAITPKNGTYKGGGIGKTQLAVEYGWKAMRTGRYWGVFFVLADTQGNLNRSLAGLASAPLLNLSEHKMAGQPAIIEAVLRELEKHKDWLLIIDNVDLKDIAKRLYEEVFHRLTNGHVLVTSCRSDWSGELTSFPIAGLSERDAVNYLLERTENERKEPCDNAGFIVEIAQKLDGHPVALEQASCYINRCHLDFNAFLTDFNKFSKHGLSWGKRDLMNYPPAVPTTSRMIEELLSPQELSILRLASFFSSEPIPIAIFERKPEKVREAAWLLRREKRIESQSFADGGKLYIRELLTELANWSLIRLAENSFRMHRIVQEFFLKEIPGDKRNLWAELALNLIDGYVCPARRPDDVKGRPFWDSIESHIRSAVTLADDYDIYEPTSRLMNELGLYLKSRERFSEAELLYLWALEIDERWHGPEHFKVAVRLNNLAQLLASTNRSNQAEFLIRRALEIDEKWFGPEHPKVAFRLNNLAEFLRDTNQVEQAEPLLRRSIEILDKNGGERLENYSAALNNLAQLLKTTGRLNEAESLLQRALEIDKRHLGVDHPKVAVRLNNLTRLLKEMGQFKKAEPLIRMSVAIDERTFGPDHPQISIGLNNLGQLLKKMNRLEEAEPLMRRALEIDEKSFGSNHSTIAVRLNNLAQLLTAKKRFKEAEFLMQRALKIDERWYGPYHPTVAIRLNNLAGLYGDTKRLEQAEPLVRRAIRIFEDNECSPPGCYTAALNNLAQLLKATHCLNEAEFLTRRALEIDEEYFGANHPNVAVDLNNLAGLLQEMNQSRKARSLMRRALRIFKDSFGPEHPKSQVVQRNLEVLK